MRNWFIAFFAAAALLPASSLPVAAGDGPPLPQGLGGPALPPGLGEPVAPPAPELVEESPGSGLPFSVTGFFDLRAGTRLQRDAYEKSESLGEVRLQAELSRSWERAGFRLTADLVHDPVLNRSQVRLNRGQGWFDLREAYLWCTPLSFMDVKVGRQIMTWGTGDLLFLNDLFPKDWNSFFIGRDVEYLKAPSDALRMTLYFPLLNVDLFYAPGFDHDRYLDGHRLSYWNASAGRLAGRDLPVRPHRPADWFDDEETGGRVFRNIGGYELALYWYAGFWKSPAGAARSTGAPTFPPLRVYGASCRGRVWRGIGSVEIAWYDSRKDRSGRDPRVRNSEARLLLGYEQEIAPDFTLGLQYYLEHMHHHSRYRCSLPPATPAGDRNRHVLTLRLNRLLLNQNLIAGVFLYWSPSDSDCYVRPNVQYKVSDVLTIEAGANLFAGRHRYTFFGQFEKNSNLYLSIRRYFTL